jgi:hypothetical protein
MLFYGNSTMRVTFEKIHETFKKTSYEFIPYLCTR